MSTERWRAVPLWDGYEASDRGRIRSVDRQLGDGRAAGGVVLRPGRDRKGYLTVSVCRDGRSSTKRVHTLVALAWLRARPRGKSVRHLDGDKDNCAPWNLRWGTQQQQERDKIHAGTRAKRVGRTDRSGKRDQEGIRTEACRAGEVETPGTRP